jgi:hypothetical protein
MSIWISLGKKSWATGRKKLAIIAMFVYLSIFNLFCWKLSKIVEQKHFVCLTILIYMNKKNLTLILIWQILCLFQEWSQVISTDYVGFTFFVGCMAMMAASAFSFIAEPVWQKWRTSVLVSGLITFIAVHYFYMRLLGKFGESPTFPLCWLGIDGAINVSWVLLNLESCRG